MHIIEFRNSRRPACSVMPSTLPYCVSPPPPPQRNKWTFIIKNDNFYPQFVIISVSAFKRILIGPTKLQFSWFNFDFIEIFMNGLELRILKMKLIYIANINTLLTQYNKFLFH
jgi:hypothetical protein